MRKAGVFLGIPYDWRLPTPGVLRERLWNPHDRRDHDAEGVRLGLVDQLLRAVPSPPPDQTALIAGERLLRLAPEGAVSRLTSARLAEVVRLLGAAFIDEPLIAAILPIRPSESG